MSFIDWNLSDESPQGQYLSQQSALAGLELQQKRQAQSALAGVDIGDPASVSSAMGGLLRAGQIDQANALTNLSYQRALNQARTPNVTTLGQLMGQDLAQYQHPSSDQPQGVAPQQQGGQPQQGQQTTGLTPDQHGAAARQILQEGADAANDLLNTTDPSARAMKAEAYRAKFAQQGVHQQNIDEVLGDLSDNGLKQHADYLQSVASGQDADHPTGMAASRAVLDADPAMRQHLSNLSGMYGDPLFRGGMKDLLGIDIGPGVDTSAAITAPLRGAEVGLAFGGPTAQVQAQGTALGSGSVGTPPVPGARLSQDGRSWILPDGTTQAITQTTQAHEAGTPREVPTQSGGTVVATPTFGPDGRATFNTGQISGGGQTQLAGQPGIAQKTGIGAEASAASNAATASQQSAAGFPTRMRDYENLRTAASQIHTGPNANFWGFLGAMKQEYAPDLPLRIGPNANDQANYEEVKKLAQRVLAYQTDTLGLPKTNQSVDITSGATPHEETSPQGIQRLVGMLEGNETYLNARNTAFNEWQRRNGKGPESWNDFIPVWNASMDPGVFQAHFMTGPEATAIRQRIGAPRFDAMQKAAQRLGYFGGY